MGIYGAAHSNGLDLGRECVLETLRIAWDLNSTDVTYGIFMYQAATLFACDIIIFLLPFPALVKLHIGSAKKTALLLVFGSGLVACIAPAIRFESIQFYKSGSSDTTCKFEDLACARR